MSGIAAPKAASDRCESVADPSVPQNSPRSLSLSLSELSDHDLLEGIQQDSEGHFRELYDRYFPRIYRYVQRRLKDDSEAEELVQEIFVAVFRSLQGYRGESSLLAWIYGIAKNTLNATWRRAASRRGKLESLDPVQFEPSRCFVDCTPEEHLILRQYVEQIREELGALSDWQAQVFAMRHFENLSIGEIAERTERTSESVRSSLYRMKRLVVEAAAADPSRRRF